MSSKEESNETGESIVKNNGNDISKKVLERCINHLKEYDRSTNKSRADEEKENRAFYFQMLLLFGETYNPLEWKWKKHQPWYDPRIADESRLAEDWNHRWRLENLIEHTRLNVDSIAPMYTSSCDEPDDMMAEGCPACKCAKVWIDNLRLSQVRKHSDEKERCDCKECDPFGQPDIQPRICRCDTDYPTTAYQLLEHVYRKGKNCEYHKMVWLYMLQCAKKVAGDGDRRLMSLSKFVRTIFDLESVRRVGWNVETNGCGSKSDDDDEGAAPQKRDLEERVDTRDSKRAAVGKKKAG